ncbi:MAG: nucleotidyl transferase AbiEii/AbiGii toxin family protein [Breznakibacter sp.]
MHKETVEQSTLELLKTLQSDDSLKDFVLVGGTALALQLGHRKSIDIDLFSRNPFNANSLSEELENKYNFYQESIDKNTLKGSIAGIKVDIITHAYPNIRPIVLDEGVRMASIEDIAAMKLNAISNSGERIKDFVDVYTLLQDRSLESLLNNFTEKYGQKNSFHTLRSLNYFNDVDTSDWPDMLNKRTTWKEVKERINQKVIAYQNEITKQPEKTLSRAIYTNNRQTVELLIEGGVKPSKQHIKLINEMKSENIKLDPMIEITIKENLPKQDRGIKM